MSRLRINLASNALGQLVAVALAVLCTPLYIRLLGVEAYGLVAFYIALQSIAQLFDLGLGPTVNRQVARASGDAAQRPSLAIFLRTLEHWYWVLGCALAVLFFFGLPALTGWWLQTHQLSRHDVVASAQIFALVALWQWPTGFYQNGLAGLQRQAALNAIVVPMSALASLGGLVFIWLGPRSVTALIAWQAAMGALQLALLHHRFWRLIGLRRSSARIDPRVFLEHWRFSAGMTGISATGIVVVYLDRIVLSRILPLEVFGHYSLATTLARGITICVAPVFNVYFPRFSALISVADHDSVREAYRTATQVLVALVFPLAAVLGFYSHDIAYLWLHDRALADHVAPIAVPLVVAAALNSLTHVPFALQLAHSHTRTGLLINIGLCLLLAPGIVLAAQEYGAWGGAACWLLANALNALIAIPVTHRMFALPRVSDWLRTDVLPGTAASLVLVAVVYALTQPPQHAFWTAAMLGLLWLATTAAAAASLSRTRTVLRARFL